MAKIIRKERNIVYEFYEVELTEEQEKLYNYNKEKFLDDYVYSDEIEFTDSVRKEYIKTTDTEYYLDSEEEPKFNY
jgi:hypothetical protein